MNGGSNFLWNAGTLLAKYKVSNPRIISNNHKIALTKLNVHTIVSEFSNAVKSLYCYAHSHSCSVIQKTQHNEGYKNMVPMELKIYWDIEKKIIYIKNQRDATLQYVHY